MLWDTLIIGTGMYHMCQNKSTEIIAAAVHIRLINYLYNALYQSELNSSSFLVTLLLYRVEIKFFKS